MDAKSQKDIYHRLVWTILSLRTLFLISFRLYLFSISISDPMFTSFSSWPRPFDSEEVTNSSTLLKSWNLLSNNITNDSFTLLKTTKKWLTTFSKITTRLERSWPPVCLSKASDLFYSFSILATSSVCFGYLPVSSTLFMFQIRTIKLFITMSLKGCQMHRWRRSTWVKLRIIFCITMIGNSMSHTCNCTRKQSYAFILRLRH